MEIAVEQLKKLGKYCNVKSIDYQNLLVGLNEVQTYAEINTPLRISMFLAQCLHETGGFVHLRELGSDYYFRKYEFRKDLGNIYKGDGAKYKGRGLIQLTGRYNYTACGKDLNLPLVEQPFLAERYPVAVQVAGWFWKEHSLNYYADMLNIYKCTKRINGGYNGIEDRKMWYDRCKQIFIP